MTQLPSEKPELFKGRHFNHLLIIQAVRWYVTYKLSYRDVCDLMAERGVTVVHTTVLRWVQRFVPAFEKKWKNYTRPVGSSWRVDETYIKVKGQWSYLYRAVDKQGRTIDFLLTEDRDKAAAVRFFKKAIGNHDVPEKITLDGSRASHQAVAELKAEGVLPAQTLVRTNKYLNNMIEQDHRKVKQRCYPMLGFKTFGNAEVTLSGIELANKIKKGQFDTSEITSPRAMILQVWKAVLAAYGEVENRLSLPTLENLHQNQIHSSRVGPLTDLHSVDCGDAPDRDIGGTFGGSALEPVSDT